MTLSSLHGRSALLDRALAVAAWAHRGQVRRSWPRPYVEHCVEVAELLAAYGVDDERLLAAALLHDVLEDTDVGSADLVRLFGDDVVALVEEVTEDARRPHDERKAAHLRRLHAAPVGAVLVFAADKLVGVRDLAARLAAPAADHLALIGTIEAKLAHAREAVALAGLVPPRWQVLFDDLEAAVEQAEALGGDKRHAGAYRRRLAGRDATMAETVLELVGRQASRTPDACALLDGGRGLTYAGLWERSGRVAARLLELGARRETVVGLCGARSADLVTGLLGILRSGAAYLPLDASYPRERLAFMLRETGAALVLGHLEVAAGVDLADATLVPLDGVAEGRGEWAEARPPAEPPRVSPDDLCYVIYTSGSTGTPKGVMLEHRVLANLVEWQLDDSACGEGARTLQFSPISFDVSFQEIFATFAAGGTLVCIGEDDRRDPQRLWEVIARERIERVFLPFVALQGLSLFADELDERDVALREVVTAGEQLVCNERVKRLFQRLRGCRLVNQYGPAETHVVTRHALPESPATWPLLPPIGSPLPGVRLYVLGEDGAPVETGEPGELYVAGVAVGRGYWGRPDLTAERFIPEPRPGRAGRMYRTGDVVRARPDGELDFLGREDDQVKIHGFRVELAEVESALVAHPAVREAAVVVQGLEATEKELVAYLAADPDALRDVGSFAAARLPAYMVPSRFHAVQALPHTPSGKLDRRALAERSEPARRSEPMRERGDGSDVEGEVRRALAEVLGEDGSEAGFLDRGGDSIAAARVAARLAERLDAAVLVSWVLESSSPLELARRVAEAPRRPRARRTGDDRLFPVSASQRQVLLEEEFDTLGRPLLVAGELAVHGPVSLEHVESAFRALVARHGALRTRYDFEGADFRQEVVEDVEPRLRVVEAAGRAGLAELRRAELETPFDLRAPTVPRLAAVRLDADTHHLLFVSRHVACDGWSLNLVLSELAELYSAAVEGRRPRLREPAPQFVEVAELAAEPDEEELAYWTSRLAGAPDVLELPLDSPRPTAQQRSGGRVSFALEPETAAALRRAAREAGATSYALLLAAFAAHLGGLAGSEDVCVALPMSGRTTADAMDAVGMFANTVAVRTALDPDEPFASLLARVQRRMLEAHDRQNVPFGDIVQRVAPRRSSAYHPIAQVMLTMQPNALRAVDLAGGARAEIVLDLELAETTRYDLVANWTSYGDELRGWIDYDAALFERATAERITAGYRRLVERVAADPSAPVGGTLEPAVTA